MNKLSINSDPSWIGKKFQRLTVTEICQKSGTNQSRWNCVCECGNTALEVRPSELKSGRLVSCGCYKKESDRLHFIGSRRTHGDSETRLFRIWTEMRRRCHNPHDAAFPRYGGRGICVCDEWYTDYSAFAVWSRENGYTDELTIDRIDGDKGYSPDNCRWATYKEQSTNRRCVRLVEIDGQRFSLKEACAIKGVSYKAVQLRITRYGYSIEDAFNKPFQKRKKRLECN